LDNNKVEPVRRHDAREKIRENLFVSLISDVLDSQGYRDQALPPRIRCLDDDLVLLGRARTGLYRDVYHVEPNHNPYELEIKLVDDLQPDDVLVLACGNSGRIAPWGSLLTTASIARGASGCLTDGYVRDIRTIRKLKFPVFHGGVGPLDSKGRGEVAAIDVPVEIAGVKVNPGDLIFGDADGVVIIPSLIEAEVVELAFERLKGEHRTEEALRNGDKLQDVFQRFGIL
jgi:4-hydroxy-4-methyl-2-oxoglutarate aldolase